MKETKDLLMQLVRAKKRLSKLMNDIEEQSFIKFGFTDKLPEIHIYEGIGEVARELDQFATTKKTEIDDFPYEMRIEQDGIVFFSMYGNEE